MPHDLYPCFKCGFPLAIAQGSDPWACGAKRVYARCKRCKRELEILPDFTTRPDQRGFLPELADSPRRISPEVVN